MYNHHAIVPPRSSCCSHASVIQATFLVILHTLYHPRHIISRHPSQTNRPLFPPLFVCMTFHDLCSIYLNFWRTSLCVLTTKPIDAKRVLPYSSTTIIIGTQTSSFQASSSVQIIFSWGLGIAVHRQAMRSCHPSQNGTRVFPPSHRTSHVWGPSARFFTDGSMGQPHTCDIPPFFCSCEFLMFFSLTYHASCPNFWDFNFLHSPVKTE